MATCPECDADLDLDEGQAEEGDYVDCPECGDRFVVTGTDPLELEVVDDDDEDDEDDEDEADDEEEEDEFSDDDDLGEDEEEDEGEDWEE